MLLLSETCNPFTYAYIPGYILEETVLTDTSVTLYTKTYARTIAGETAWGYLPKDISMMPDGTYIYLTEWNTENQALVFKPSWYDMKDSASGMRQIYPFDFVGLPIGCHEVYRQGNAVLLQKGQ
jgi:hypothetical protein